MLRQVPKGLNIGSQERSSWCKENVRIGAKFTFKSVHKILFGTYSHSRCARLTYTPQTDCLFSPTTLCADLAPDKLSRHLKSQVAQFCSNILSRSCAPCYRYYVLSGLFSIRPQLGSTAGTEGSYRFLRNVFATSRNISCVLPLMPSSAVPTIA